MGAVLSVFPFLTGAIVGIIAEVRVVIIRGCMTLKEWGKKLLTAFKEDSKM